MEHLGISSIEYDIEKNQIWLSSRKDKQLTLKKLVKLNQIVGFLSEKYNEGESEEAS